MEKKLCVFDIDGTLVDFDGIMPQSTKMAIEQLKANGHIVALCTGRCKPQIYPFVLNLGFDAIIASAGAYAEHKNKILINKYFDKKEIDIISSYMIEKNYPFAFYSNASVFVLNNMLEKLKQMLMGHFADGAEDPKQVMDRFCGFDDVKTFDYNSYPIQKVLYYSDTPSIKDVTKDLQDKFTVERTSFAVPTECSGEITIKGLDKGSALKVLSEYLKIDKKNIVAFGDGPNDISMLSFAGIGVVMGNAYEDIKSFGDIVAPCIKNDGIAKVLKQLNLI